MSYSTDSNNSSYPYKRCMPHKAFLPVTPGRTE